MVSTTLCCCFLVSYSLVSTAAPCPVESPFVRLTPWSATNVPSRHNSVGILSNAVGTCTLSPSFDCCVATAVPWYWLNSIPNIHRAKPYPTTCLDLKVASWAPWPMSSQGGEQTPGMLLWKHKEPCALIARRRQPGSQEDRPQQKPSLPTPWLWTCSRSNCKKQISVGWAIEAVVFCYGSPNKLVHPTFRLLLRLLLLFSSQVCFHPAIIGQCWLSLCLCSAPSLVPSVEHSYFYDFTNLWFPNLIIKLWFLT